MNFVFPSSPIASVGRPGFCSAKCQPLQYPRRACRDFLVLASLDPSTTSIHPGLVDLHHAPRDCYFSVRLSRRDGELIVMLCETTDGPHRLSTLTIGLALPRSALNTTSVETARIVWSRRNVRVDPAFSILVQKRLSQLGELTFGDAIDLEDFRPADASDWIMALACSGLIDLHISGHLKPETRITLPAPIIAAL